MSEELLDEDGYPTDETLDRIAAWTHTDITGLIAFIRNLWRYPNFWTEDGDRVHISTGGWSGNESMIAAMERNRMFMAICWVSSRRGGHYEFDLSRAKAMEKV